ncbi:MAG: hypothetical protein ACJ8AG_11045 [Ktedonobacteraceae bacterium]
MSLDPGVQDHLEENCLEQPKAFPAYHSIGAGQWPKAFADQPPVSPELLARDVPEVHEFP